jgi:decaprenyl-phosphate phosphoribosyltransferase
MTLMQNPDVPVILKEAASTAKKTGIGDALIAHLQIARVDHWVKNVFVLPGIIVAISIDRSVVGASLFWRILVGLAAVCLIASSNYVLNELLDAASDRMHPTKHTRPVPSGRVYIGWAYAEWIVLMILGLLIGLCVSTLFSITLAALWIMGCAYNIPPMRTKDVPYLDVLTEAINNPLRMLAGWYLTLTVLLPPASLLMSYWMAGCYFMAIKRFAEYREIGDAKISAAYRRSFSYYSEARLQVSIMFYGTHAMLFFGAYLMRYRMELILSFPLIALVMTVYFAMSFRADSAAQRPEMLYREPLLMMAVISCAAVMIFLLFVDVPILHQIFIPSVSR